MLYILTYSISQTSKKNKIRFYIEIKIVYNIIVLKHHGDYMNNIAEYVFEGHIGATVDDLVVSYWQEDSKKKYANINKALIVGKIKETCEIVKGGSNFSKVCIEQLGLSKSEASMQLSISICLRALFVATNSALYIDKLPSSARALYSIAKMSEDARQAYLEIASPKHTAGDIEEWKLDFLDNKQIEHEQQRLKQLLQETRERRAALEATMEPSSFAYKKEDDDDEELLPPDDDDEEEEEDIYFDDEEEDEEEEEEDLHEDDVAQNVEELKTMLSRPPAKAGSLVVTEKADLAGEQLPKIAVKSKPDLQGLLNQLRLSAGEAVFNADTILREYPDIILNGHSYEELIMHSLSATISTFTDFSNHYKIKLWSK